MLKKGYKGKCEKKALSKCKGVCKTYTPMQTAYADVLQNDNGIKEFNCNVPLDDENYTSDFVCTKNSGDLFIRECVYRKYLTKPLTVKLLDISREYWLKRGVTDWGIVVDEKK